MIEDAVDFATTAVTKTITTVQNTVATALSGVKDAVSNFFGSADKFIKQIDLPQVPMPNPLFDYASYTYIIGVGCLSKEEINNPDDTYIAGKPINLICKNAHSDPENRVLTAYGKFDFYITRLEINNLVGFGHDMNSTFVSMEFDIVEPYSMGLFLMSCQQLAQQLGHETFRQAPYVLTIEFRGNTETGQMHSIPNTNRFLPFNFSDIEMEVTAEGSKYRCSCVGTHLEGLSDKFSTLKSDVSVKGKTVQEILQTGEKSLQAVVNQRFKQYVDQKIRTVSDEIIILFPENVATADMETASANKEIKDSATTSKTPSSGQSVYQKLGVTRSSKNNTLVQQEGMCNALGKASLGFSDSRKGDTPVGKDNVIWDPDKGVFVRGNNPIDAKESDARFRQDTNIPNAINQVLLNSDFVKQTFDASMMTDTGMRNMWSIEVQTYIMGETEAATGQPPKLIVYRVVPYQAHSSNLMPPNTKAPGFDNLKKQALKEYNYIYTGKNIDIIDFSIKFNNGFVSIMSADLGQKSADVKTSSQTSRAAEPIAYADPLGKGQKPSDKTGTTPSQVDYVSTKSETDKKGGGGTETASVRAARLFMDSITKDADLYEINLTIIGDPYYIANSGMGNYTSAPTQYSNLNYDGSMNYQNGEVDILVNFRTPIDINETTGLFNFTGTEATAPVLHYSGLYKVAEVTSIFEDGKFQQTINCLRRFGQEYEQEVQASSTFNLSNLLPPAMDQYYDP